VAGSEVSGTSTRPNSPPLISEGKHFDLVELTAADGQKPEGPISIPPNAFLKN